MMKKQILLILLFAAMTSIPVFSQLPEKAEDISPLLNGETIPDIALKAPDGSAHQMAQIIEDKPSILIFYRGGWCPYCNAHLSEIQEVEAEIINLGYQLIGISPDSPENLKVTDEKKHLNYRLYSDASGEFTKAMGLAFKSPEKYSGMLRDVSDGQNQGFLPVPSVFVVDQSGTILFEYINPNYKTRLSAKLLLAILLNLDVKPSNQLK
jgi:peroxiredoxin